MSAVDLGTTIPIGPHRAGEDPEARSARLAAMREGAVGSVHSWELVTAVDGPGTRLTVFLAGCPLRCRYCHNPDTMQLRQGSIETAESVLARVRRYAPVLKATGGGVTLSGGEALFQPAFAHRIFAGAHAMGLHTALDTSGFLGRQATDEFLESVDLVLLDVKSGSEEVYRDVTGRALQPTIDFGDRLEALGKDVWIRFVVVPGLTDAPENVERVARIVARWPHAVRRVEVLPFHTMGVAKWKELGLEYTLEGTRPPSEETVERVREQFRAVVDAEVY